jgi:hypothetical protein
MDLWPVEGRLQRTCALHRKGWKATLKMLRRRRTPVTARAVAGARSERGLGRGRAWAAARRGRATAGARGRATAGRWAGWDAAKARLCTPPRSRTGPPRRTAGGSSTGLPTRSIPSGPSPRSASGGERWRHRLRGQDLEVRARRGAALRPDTGRCPWRRPSWARSEELFMAQITVPNVVGLGRGDAEKKLDEAHLRYIAVLPQGPGDQASRWPRSAASRAGSSEARQAHAPTPPVTRLPRAGWLL